MLQSRWGGCYINVINQLLNKINSVLEDLKSSISKKEIVIKSQQRIQELEENQKVRLLKEGEILAGEELFAIDIYE